MTITHEQWQTVVLTLLILSLAVILKRSAILIALVVDRSWSKHQRSQTFPNESSQSSDDSNESHSLATLFGHDDIWVQEGHLMDGLVDSGSTGYTPSGVGYVPENLAERQRAADV